MQKEAYKRKVYLINVNVDKAPNVDNVDGRAVACFMRRIRKLDEVRWAEDVSDESDGLQVRVEFYNEVSLEYVKRLLLYFINMELNIVWDEDMNCTLNYIIA